MEDSVHFPVLSLSQKQFVKKLIKLNSILKSQRKRHWVRYSYYIQMIDIKYDFF